MRRPDALADCCHALPQVKSGTGPPKRSPRRQSWFIARTRAAFIPGGLTPSDFSKPVFGYRTWSKRLPTRGAGRVGKAPAPGELARAPKWGIAAVLAVSLLPIAGIAFIGFVLLDTLLAPRRNRAAQETSQTQNER